MDERVLQILQEKTERNVADLKRLLRQPSISAQGIGMLECAQMLRDELAALGGQAELHLTPGHPIVTAVFPGEGPKTLLVYGHYDVQPPEPLEEWKYDPFGAEEVDGKIFARGAVDDKGNFYTAIKAVQAYKEAGVPLPLTVKFIIEGEEEVSSASLYDFVKEHKDLLQADALIGIDGNFTVNGYPQMLLGRKGMCYVQLTARTARDHHSMRAPLLVNPAWRLVWALNTLKNEREEVLIEGFYDDVLEPTEEEMQLLAELDWNPEALLQEAGQSEFLLGLEGLEAKKRLHFAPTCTICGIGSGYMGQGPKTVIPSVASAKVDMRLVPNQKPADILAKLRKHLDKHGFSDIEIESLGGLEGCRTSPHSPIVRAMQQSITEAFVLKPSIMPSIPGSGPAYVFKEHLNLNQITACFGPPEDLNHAPNEYIFRSSYLKGIEAIARLFKLYSQAE
ncbi:MAG: M20/M25/M40 family metallo-hydrolase [Firmicutes bacterium]|nr:M20/M25/M40 family metallo-hydrolase [Bacillota bacterium]